MVDNDKSQQEIETCIVLLGLNKIDGEDPLFKSLYTKFDQRKIIIPMDDPDCHQEDWPNVHLLKVGKDDKAGTRLKSAMQCALSLRFTHVITVNREEAISSTDISGMLLAVEETPESILIGSPCYKKSNKQSSDSLSKKRADLLFKIQTGEKIPTPESQFRVYPLHGIKRLKLWSKGPELNIEILVKACWNNILVTPIEVGNSTTEGFDPPLRSFAQRMRLAILHASLLLLAIFYFIPKRFFFKEGLVPTIKAELSKDESTSLKAASIGFGLMMSVTPIWGFQSIVGLPIAVLFRMNRVLFLLFVNLSIPPFIPFIVYASFLLGSPFVVGNSVEVNSVSDFDMETIQINFLQYTYGSMILAMVWGGLGFLISYFILSLTKSSNT